MASIYDTKVTTKVMKAGKKPGKAGKVGKMFLLESKGARGKLPMGGGKKGK